MNHTKHRVWLIFIALAVVVFGILWYTSDREEEKPLKEGTLVWRELPEQENAAFHPCGSVRESGEEAGSGRKGLQL